MGGTAGGWEQGKGREGTVKESNLGKLELTASRDNSRYTHKKQGFNFSSK
jgi:hypothetical protein